MGTCRNNGSPLPAFATPNVNHAILYLLLGGFALAAERLWPAGTRQVLHAVSLAAGRMAQRKWLVGAGLVAVVMGVRAALLPWWPIPHAVIYDEFSYLLQADIFAHGRLAMPMHPMWRFFETIYVLQKPAMASRYPPGQALAMAVGQILMGHPWFGVWLSAGVLAAVFWWAFRAWLPRGWPLIASALALPLCIYSYWMNSFWGGAVTAIGGALVTGAMGRLQSGKSRSSPWLLGLGAVILIYCRPWEGLLLLAPALLWLAVRNRSWRVWLPVVTAGAAGMAGLAFDNYAVTGNPLRLPYFEYSAQYASTSPFSFVPPRPRPNYGHFNLELIDQGWERATWEKTRSWQFLRQRPGEWYLQLTVLLGSGLLLALLIPGMLVRRVRLLAILALFMLGGSLLQGPWFSHYAAPFTASLFILAVSGMRVLHTRSPALAFALPTAVLLAAAATGTRDIARHRTPDQIQPIVSQRDAVAARLLNSHPGRHVVFVKYTVVKIPHDEWIYNLADIDAQTLIWAQDMGEAENRRLMDYYPGRQFWLFQPDDDIMKMTPLP